MKEQHTPRVLPSTARLSGRTKGSPAGLSCRTQRRTTAKKKKKGRKKKKSESDRAFKTIGQPCFLEGSLPRILTDKPIQGLFPRDRRRPPGFTRSPTSCTDRAHRMSVASRRSTKGLKIQMTESRPILFAMMAPRANHPTDRGNPCTTYSPMPALPHRRHSDRVRYMPLPTGIVTG